VPSENGESDSILLRPAVEADAHAIAEIECKSFAHAEERFELRRVRHLIRNPRIIVRVAEENGELLGWVAGFVWLRGKIPWGRVYAIAVDPKARGRKVGQQLMQNMIGILETRGAYQIFLEVSADNPTALRLYEKLGFRECRALPNFYGHGLAAVRMVRITGSSPSASP
jgi:[ribosomal protein S18]-alanine N-acetyltransferase